MTAPPSGAGRDVELTAVRLAAFGVGFATLLGTFIVILTVLGVNALRETHIEAAFYLLAAGTLSGLTAAAVAAWRLLAPLGSDFRRGSFAIVSAFATVVLMLLALPIHGLLGRGGLLGLAALSALGCLGLWWRIGRRPAQS